MTADLEHPIFIVSAARSGSTLLRYLLDSHPRIVAPPESNLAAAASTIVATWRLEHDLSSRAHRDDLARRHVRALVEEYAAYHCARAGKDHFCDKSLATASMSEALVDAFPDARFVVLHRHAMDVIASGIEASPWGFTGYGFEQYVQPGNFVAGLAQYWCTVTTSLLALEQKLGERAIRLGYERLATDTDTVMDELCRFLGLEWEPSIVAGSFSSVHGRGPGDHKVDYTSSPHTGSIGRGVEVPPELVPRQILLQMNGALALLGYPEVGEEWSLQASPLRVAFGTGPSTARSAPTPALRRLERLLRRNISRLPAAHRAGETLAERAVVVVEDGGAVRTWLVGFEDRTFSVGDATATAPVTLYCDAGCLLEIALGLENPGVLAARNKVRMRGPGSAGRQVLRQLQGVLTGEVR